MKSTDSIDHQASIKPWRYLVLMGGAGLHMMLAQILLIRELLVAFYGNELTLSAMLSAWLIIIGLGSLTVQLLLRRLSPAALLRLVALLLLLLAVALPLQVWCIRSLRALLQVPYGEYVAFDAMLLSSALILLPTCLSMGMLFPAVCHLRGLGDPRAVSRLYAVEALGSMLGGGLFTFLLIFWLTPLTTVALASLIALGAAALLLPPGALRAGLLGLSLFLAALVSYPPSLADLEWRSLETRWRACGCLPARTAAAQADAGRLAASLDSPYQNLALIEAQGQTTLYGNGQIMAVFPDPISAEHKIHFIMAQNPAAARVLLVGGNPATEIPELLKYPLQRLVHLEPDGALVRLLERVGAIPPLPAADRARLELLNTDGLRFLKTTEETFDIIIIAAPAPTTIALSRFYTREFYQAAQQRLTATGFLYTAVEASEQLLDAAASLSASVAGALQAVFPRVLVTSGTQHQYFAGGQQSPLTFERQILFQRSRAAGLAQRYFRPEYFLNADEIDPAKTHYVRQRLAAISVPANTMLRPVAAFYHLLLWSRFSGSRLEQLLSGANQMRWMQVGAFLGAGGSLLWLLGAALGSRRRTDALLRKKSHGRRVRPLLGFVLLSTGLSGLALELVLIFMFQGLLGYIYARIGLLVAIFMLGLALGALLGGRLETAPEGGAWTAMIGLDLLLLALAACMPAILQGCAAAADLMSEGTINLLILLVGGVVGAQFVLVNRLLRASRLSLGAAAALANAADLGGAALGGLVIGVVLLPLWGIWTVCWLLAALKGISLVAGLAARQAARGRA